MPHNWNNILVVTKDELVPNWYNTENTLYSEVKRYSKKEYGIKRVQLGGNGRTMLISFDSLPAEIQDGIGDPRKLNHILERFYKVDSDAVRFYSNFKFDDGTYLDTEYQERYIINASVLKAAIALRDAREVERRTKGGNLVGITQSILSDVQSFNVILDKKHNVRHTLPPGEKQFKKLLKDFETGQYISIISGKHKNANRRKVNDATVELLNNLFAGQATKPTATEVHRQYEAFMNGYLEVINNETSEIYNPADFKTLGATTVTNYIAQWSNKIGTYAKRSGDRQKLMQQFKPFHSLDKPKYAGSIISIDDRQPPFKMADGSRIWFYNGIDLGSEAFTCWVYGKSKEGIILEFYRQMVRNYADWGFNLPAELEAEMSLNSSFTSSFLKEGAMFQYVRIEANNARGKRIEAYYRPLRYNLEKKRIGWLARPHALTEANQPGAKEVPTLPYNDIVQGCLEDIETWNNMPHSVHTHMSRWEVFTQKQHPNLQPTNYAAILPYVGYRTETSCNVGMIQLNNGMCLLGDAGKVATGNKLINLMNQVEGKDVEVYWLDDNEGNLLKAHVYIGTQLICEAVAKPRYQKARIEQTPEDYENRKIMSSYVATIEAYARRQKKAIDTLTIIDNTPKPKKSFVMPGLKSRNENVHPENGNIIEESTALLTESENYTSHKKSLKERF
ncbi:Uncharacterised protein [Sphingobacterium spiritivorum]|uniref:Uncharacterized protein n=1 Tax=Sphingobacterium spiritivorum TaxID=258 RepID=A0A380CQ11_SPHSI|nr:hypothetical protein [Sphingobacterium spiritivorum]SUJ26378.1 Uncharacterised protein [Sphingobacterium spiritivorum]